MQPSKDRRCAVLINEPRPTRLSIDSHPAPAKSQSTQLNQIQAPLSTTWLLVHQAASQFKRQEQIWAARLRFAGRQLVYHSATG